VWWGVVGWWVHVAPGWAATDTGRCCLPVVCHVLPACCAGIGDPRIARAGLPTDLRVRAQLLARGAARRRECVPSDPVTSSINISRFVYVAKACCTRARGGVIRMGRLLNCSCDRCVVLL
jgi:hypothetical protein